MKKALVLGLGVSGKSVVTYLKKKDYFVYEVDKHNEQEPFLDRIIDEILFLVKSPGIAWTHPLVQKAGTKVTSEIELAFQELQSSEKRIVAITGSNGKTTTALLTTHILNSCGKRAVACGNIGNPLLSCLDSDAEILVVELSSYQLEKLRTSVIDIGVITNITPNHLDRYDSFEDYGRTKWHLANLIKKEGLLFVNKTLNLFGFQKGSHHLYYFPELKIPEGTFPFPLAYPEGGPSHDFENIRAAFSVCKSLGINEIDFWDSVKTFKKPPHRLEFVRQLRGVNFINDSKSTSVDSVLKAVDSFPGEVILIVGGVDKGGSYQKWNVLFQNKVKKILVFGQAKNKIYEEIHRSLDTEIIDTLPEALEKAVMYAKDGETVLFSPGCSSYDQFTSFEHRGDVFKTLVGKL